MTQETPLWAAERTVAPEEVATWLMQEGYQVRSPIVLIAQGFDNFIFQHEELYIRVTRRRIAAPDILKEVQLLPKLHKLLPTAVPTPTIIPKDIQQQEWPWFAFAPVQGNEVAQVLLDEPNLNHVAKVLGQTLRVLHCTEMFEQTRHWVREDTYRRMDMPHRIKQARARLEDLKNDQIQLPYDALSEALNDAGDLGVLPHQALVHGDLHMRHVIVDEAYQMRGIIDWGDAHIGHQGCDFYPYWSLLDHKSREVFLSQYGQVDDATMLSGRVVAIYINAILAISADDFELPGLKKAAIQGLINAAAH